MSVLIKCFTVLRRATRPWRHAAPVRRTAKVSAVAGAVKKAVGVVAVTSCVVLGGASLLPPKPEAAPMVEAPSPALPSPTWLEPLGPVVVVGGGFPVPVDDVVASAPPPGKPRCEDVEDEDDRKRCKRNRPTDVPEPAAAGLFMAAILIAVIVGSNRKGNTR